MRAEHLRVFLSQQPFVPLRLHLSDGSAHEIRHPELALVTRTFVRIAYPAADPMTLAADGAVFVVLRHITRLELLIPAPPASAN
jgi:hypothetical protein